MTQSTELPMLDALLLLNSLRAIEEDFGLQQWSAHVSSGVSTIEEMAADVRGYGEEGEMSRTIS